jgi:hypothetical protein
LRGTLLGIAGPAAAARTRYFQGTNPAFGVLAADALR